MANIESPASPPGGEVVVYEAPDGEVRVDVRFDRETVWLTQQQMAELFGRDRSVVTRHIGNAFREGELVPGATSAKFAQVRSEGGRTVSREVDHYNLDVIISVGYRVKSLRGHAIPHLGHPNPARAPDPRLHRERTPPCRARDCRRPARR